MGAAKKGLEALKITWDEGPNASFSTAASAPADAERIASHQGVAAESEGDAPKVIAAAARKVEAIYEMPFLAHTAMEPMNCTVHVRGDGCDVWVGTQVHSRAQATAAAVTGLPLEKVRSTIISSAADSAGGSTWTASPRRWRSPSRWIIR